MSCSQVCASAPCTWTAVRAQLAAASPAAALASAAAVQACRGCGAGIAEAGRGRVGEAAGAFHADVVVGQRVFDPLERADRRTELAA